MAAFHKSARVSSEKSAENSALPVDPSGPRRNPLSFKLAARIALRLGMPRTWPNVETIRLGIESEAILSSVSLEEASEVILKAAREWSRRPEYSCPSTWEIHEIFRDNTVDRFWFEDARWRHKWVYTEFRERLTEASA